eukprot:scaffold1614_cov173-Pinguiococcus_pyrenoidosus.AAC.4
MLETGPVPRRRFSGGSRPAGSICAAGPWSRNKAKSCHTIARVRGAAWSGSWHLSWQMRSMVEVLLQEVVPSTLRQRQTARPRPYDGKLPSRRAGAGASLQRKAVGPLCDPPEQGARDHR